MLEIFTIFFERNYFLFFRLASIKIPKNIRNSLLLVYKFAEFC